MLIAPAGEWRQLADHLETGKVKSKASFLHLSADRSKIAAFIRERCAGRMDTAQVGIEGRSYYSSSKEPVAWNETEAKSLLSEAKKLNCDGFREVVREWTGASYDYDAMALDADTLKPLRDLAGKLEKDQTYLAACFQRVCFALDPTDKSGSAGGGIDDYAGDEEVLRLLADAKRLAVDLADLGALIYQRACERGL